MSMQKIWKEPNPSQLYLLHIPKTGGTSVSATLRHQLDDAGLPWHRNARPPHDYDFSKFVYIDSHLGNSPKVISNTTTVACMVRNPIERSISNFLWIYESVLMKNKNYHEMKSLIDRLKFYLFDDEDYAFHRNIQSRFICGSVSDSVFLSDFEFSYVDYSKTWFINDSPISSELAINNLKGFHIVGTTENHDAFMDLVSEWIFSNLCIQVKREKRELALRSEVKEHGEIFTTDSLIHELSNAEKVCITENNKLDFEVYNYVKENQYFGDAASLSSVIV